MFNKIKLKDNYYRQSTHYSFGDKSIPEELNNSTCEVPDLSGFPYPLPSKKSSYKCFDECDGVLWLGSDTGLTRVDLSAEYDYNKVMNFSADRDLLDNNVKSVFAKGNGVWVKTESGVTHIELIKMSPREVSEMLLNESLKYVDRQGMVSQRRLRQARNRDSALPYANSDNDGGFTAMFCMGELFRYAVLKRELGENAPETVKAKKDAQRSLDACMLLMYIHGRGDGFVARTYLFEGEPVPDDGYFFKRKGNVATCINNKGASEKGYVGCTSDCSTQIPEKLRYLYEACGKTPEDIIYKADTSSDEITIQLLNCYFAHLILGSEDKELDEFIKQSVKGIANHIIDNGFVLKDFTGKSTTWARWDPEYFCSEDGWVDAALNSAEMLFILKVTMAITGEEGKWAETYNMLIDKLGYADLTEKHFDRMYQAALADNIDFPAGIMYGDHFLASAAFYGLCTLEKDETLLEKYRNGYKSWRSSMRAEHNPGYDFLYLLGVPDDTIDSDKTAEWFYRYNTSRLAASVSTIGRHDLPVRELRGNYCQVSTLLPPDELFISKYDRDPFELKNQDHFGKDCIESAYTYNFAYWLGKYSGFIE